MSAGARLTHAQQNMLSNAVHGRLLTDGLHGRSAHGGASGTEFALRRRGLLDENGRPTEAGRAVFAPKVPS